MTSIARGKLTGSAHHDKWRRSMFCFVAIFLVSLQGARAQESTKPLVVWDFDHALVNPLGGEYNAFQKSPSWARTYLEPVTRPGKPGHTLRITAHRAAAGFCGVWFDFYSQKDIPQRYLDARAYQYLSFRVKGQVGGEDFEVTLKDNTWRKHEDTNPTLPLHAYLSHGVTPEWQEVLIPLRDFEGLDLSRIFNLVFVFNKDGDFNLQVDEIAFTNGSMREATGRTVDAEDSVPSKYGRGLWVWKTKKLLGPAHAVDMDRFLRFCATENVRQVFLSLEIHKSDAKGDPHYDLKDADDFRSFLEGAHKAGLEVDALAGTPEWAAEANHAQALAVIDAVAEFNRASPSTSRFDGVHFDVEPYSLVGYADPAFRPQLLKEFLSMVSKCAERARTAPGLRFSCDVPAWFYPSDELTRQDLTVDFQGSEKSVGEHLTDLLDSVTIMDYRNEADGAGGILQSGRPALEYAAARGKKIQVGLETSVESDRTIYFVCGLPLEEFQKRMASSGLRDELYLGDYRLATFSDEINVHLGLTAPEKLEGEVRTEFERTLAKLALAMGASSDPRQFPPDEILAEAQAALERDPEFSGFDVFKFADPATGRAIRGFSTIRHMPPRITFYGLGHKTFDEETRSLVEWFSAFPSFQGLAIHYYDSYRDLVEGP